MKWKLFIGVLLISFSAVLFAFTGQQSTIIGKVTPAESAEMAWAIGTADSVKSIIADGRFTLQVKPGRYRVVVLAKPPHKNITIENVVAKEGEITDMGEIMMKQ